MTIGIDSEMLVGSPAMVVYGDSISTWEGRPIGAEKKKQILDNIRETFAAQGLQIDIQE